MQTLQSLTVITVLWIFWTLLCSFNFFLDLPFVVLHTVMFDIGLFFSMFQLDHLLISTHHHPSIPPSIHSMPLIVPRVAGSPEPIPGKAGDPGQGANPSHRPFTHYGQFVNAKSANDVLGEETGVLAGNPLSIWRTYKLWAHRAETRLEQPTLQVQGKLANH